MDRFFIRFLQGLMNVLWWVAIPFFSIITLVIAYKIIGVGTIEHDIPVYLKSTDKLTALRSLSPADLFISTGQAEALLKLKLGLTPGLIIFATIGYSLSMLVLFGILYQLRKIFRSLKKQAPFAVENTRRLQIIGYLIFGSAALSIFDGIVNTQILNTRFVDAHLWYAVKINYGFIPIAIGMVVLILSEIIRQGTILRTDNESFI